MATQLSPAASQAARVMNYDEGGRRPGRPGNYVTYISAAYTLTSGVGMAWRQAGARGMLTC